MPRFSFPSQWRQFQSMFKVSNYHTAAAAAAKLLQSCSTLCNLIDGSPPGSPVPGILQATTLEWVAISFSNAWKWKVKIKSLSRVWFFATPWTAAYQAPPSMGFSRQEYWSGVPLPSLLPKLDVSICDPLLRALSQGLWGDFLMESLQDRHSPLLSTVTFLIPVHKPSSWSWGPQISGVFCFGFLHS